MNNTFKVYSDEVLREIAGDKADEIKRLALRYGKDKRISYIAHGRVSGFEMITLLIVGNKAKGLIKRGYNFSYCYNLDCPNCSELGDCFVEKIGNDYKRIG